MRHLLFLPCLCLLLFGAARAQTSGDLSPRPVPENPAQEEKKAPETFEPDTPIVRKAKALMESRKSPLVDEFLEMYKNPMPQPVQYAPLSTRPLSGREVARKAAGAYVRVGWIFQCTKCSRWHTELAGGYAIAQDTVATAHHVLAAPQTMRPGAGLPVVVRAEDDVLSIAAVLAADASSDTAVLRVGCRDLKPLGLSSDVEPGDNVFCLSDPRGLRGMFTTGIVNRITTVPNGSPKKPADRRLNVSADWAPGSSGAPVLDACGNVIGHVASVISLYANESKKVAEGKETARPAPSVMTVHVAIPAQTVRALLDTEGR